MTATAITSARVTTTAAITGIMLDELWLSASVGKPVEIIMKTIKIMLEYGNCKG